MFTIKDLERINQEMIEEGMIGASDKFMDRVRDLEEEDEEEDEDEIALRKIEEDEESKADFARGN